MCHVVLIIIVTVSAVALSHVHIKHSFAVPELGDR